MAISPNQLLPELLSFERAIARSRQLATFRRSPSTWELLLYLAQFEDGAEDGLYNIVDNLQTSYLGSSAMLKFIRDRREDGLLLFTEHSKRSKWKIAVPPELRDELMTALTHVVEQLNRQMPPDAPRLHRGDGHHATLPID